MVFLLLFVIILSVGEGTVQLTSSLNLPNMWSSDNWSEREKDVKTLARRMSQHSKRMSVTVRPTAHLPSSPEAVCWRPEVVAEGHDAADCTAAYRSSIFNSVPIVLAQFCTFIAQQLCGLRPFFFFLVCLLVWKSDISTVPPPPCCSDNSNHKIILHMLISSEGLSRWNAKNLLMECKSSSLILIGC